MTLIDRQKPIEYITSFLRLRETGDIAGLAESQEQPQAEEPAPAGEVQ